MEEKETHKKPTPEKVVEPTKAQLPAAGAERTAPEKTQEPKENQPANPLREAANDLKEIGVVTVSLGEKEAKVLVKGIVEQLLAKNKRFEGELGEVEITISEAKGRERGKIIGKVGVRKPLEAPAELELVLENDERVGKIKLTELKLTTTKKLTKAEKQQLNGVEEQVGDSLKPDPNEVFKEGINAQLEEDGARAERVEVRFRGKQKHLELTLIGGKIESGEQSRVGIGSGQEGVVFRATPIKTEEVQILDIRDQLKKAQEAGAGGGKKALTEEERFAREMEPVLSLVGAKNPEAASRILAGALTAAQAAVASGEDKDFKMVDFFKQFVGLKDYLHKLGGRELKAGETEEKITILDILKALLKLIILYIRKTIETEFKDRFEELGIDPEKYEEMTDEEVMQLFYDQKRFKREKVKVKKTEKAKTAEESDGWFNQSKGLVNQMYLQVECKTEAEQDEVTEEFSRFIELLGKREEAGQKDQTGKRSESYTAVDEIELAKLLGKIRQRYLASGPARLELEDADYYPLVKRAKELGFTKPEEVWDWIFAGVLRRDPEAEESGGPGLGAWDEETGEPVEATLIEGEGGEKEIVEEEFLALDEEEEPEPNLTRKDLEKALVMIEVELDKRRERAKKIGSTFKSGSQEYEDSCSELAQIYVHLNEKNKELDAILRRQGKNKQELSGQDSETVRQFIAQFKARITNWERDISEALRDKGLEPDGETKRGVPNREEEAKSEIGKFLWRVRPLVEEREQKERQRLIKQYVNGSKQDEFYEAENQFTAKVIKIQVQLESLYEKEKRGNQTAGDLQILTELKEEFKTANEAWDGKLNPELSKKEKHYREGQPSQWGPVYDEYNRRFNEINEARGEKGELPSYMEVLVRRNELRLMNEDERKLVDRYLFGELERDNPELVVVEDNLNIIEAQDKVDKFFEDMMSEAEGDSRSGWHLGNLQPICDIYLNKFKEIDIDIYHEYNNLIMARRNFHNLHYLIETGANLENMINNSKQYGNSADRDNLGRKVKGLEAGMQIMDGEFASVLNDPRLKGHIPLWMLKIGGSGETEGGKTIVRRVADILMKYSNQGLLRNQDRVFKFSDINQALEVAGMAMKVLSADMRTMEYYAEARQPGVHGEETTLRSPFADGILKAMNPLKELYRRFEIYVKAPEVIDRMIEEVDTNAQIGMVTGTDQNKIMGNYKQKRLGGLTSIFSNWRGIRETTERMQELGMGLGLKIFTLNEKDEKKEERKELWVEAAKRLPSRMVTFFPTLSWHWEETGKHINSKQGEHRLYEGDDGLTWTRNEGREAQFMREELFSDARGLVDYAQARAALSEDYRGYIKEIETRRERHKLRDPILFRGKKEDISGHKRGRFDSIIDEKEAEGKLERRHDLLRRREERRRAFVWKLAEVYGDGLDEEGMELIGRMPGEMPRISGKTVEDRDSHEDQLEFRKNYETWFESCADWQKECDEWEARVYEKWEGENGLHGKLMTVERYAFVQYRDKVKKLGHRTNELDDEYDALMIVGRIKGGEVIGNLSLRAEDFSDKDMEMIRMLTNLGGNDAEEGAEQLAEQKLTMTQFLDDVDHTMTEFERTGQDGLHGRRYNDALDASKSVKIIGKMLESLGTYKDKKFGQTNKELVSALFEFRNSLTHLDEKQREENTRVWASVLVQDYFRADSWVENGPGPDLHGFNFLKGWMGLLGDIKFPLIGRIAKSSSVAQRRMGGDAISMTTGEVHRFVEELAPIIGHEEAQKMEDLLDSRKRDEVKSLIKQFAIPSLLYFGGGGIISALWQAVIKQPLELMKQAIKQDMGQANA